MKNQGMFTTPSPRNKSPFAHPTQAIALGAILAAAVATALAVTPGSPPLKQQTVVETLEIPRPTILDTSEQVFFSEAIIQRGDTLQRLLSRLNISDSDAALFLRTSPLTSAIRHEFIAGRTASASASGDGKLLSFYFPLSDKETALTIKRIDSEFRAELVAERPEIHIETKTARIKSSLFGATDAAGIPDSIAILMAEIFGSDIDFHSDLRKDDRFTVSYEMRYLQGQPTRTGKIVAAEFVNNGKTSRAIWFDHGGEQGEYLTPEGKPLKKAFLRSPLEFSRVSSGFSTRFHPILKTWRAHQGVDYAAPTGTPIRATANASVDFVGTQGGYGKTIVLKHDSKHSTLYAHLSRFSPGLRKGARINQGETIGYVGQTGWATGPHLHYEFRINNTPVNPLSAKLPTVSASLDAKQLALFKQQSSTRLVALDRLNESSIAYLE